MASDTLLYYNQAFVDKVKLAANTALSGDTLASFNTKIDAETAMAANLAIGCAIDRKGGNPLKVIYSEMIEANSENTSTYANRSRSVEQELYSRAFEIVDRGTKVHYFITRPNLSTMAGLGALKYAMNYASSNNSLSNLSVWYHPQINKNNGEANTVFDMLTHANRTFKVKLNRFRVRANSLSSNALSETFDDKISAGDVIVHGCNYQHANNDWDSFEKKVRYGHSNFRFALGGYWDQSKNGQFNQDNMYEFYGSYIERKVIGLSSAGSSYPQNDMIAGMKAAVVGGESNTAMIQVANNWVNNYDASATFTIRPGKTILLEKLAGVQIGHDSEFLALTANNEIVSHVSVGDNTTIRIDGTDTDVDFSSFINKENL